MSVITHDSPAQAKIESNGQSLRIALKGVWRVTSAAPRWTPPAKGIESFVTFDSSELGTWDSALILYLAGAKEWCQQERLAWQDEGLPDGAQRLLLQLSTTQDSKADSDRSEGLFHYVGSETQRLWKQGREIAQFVGECFLALVRLARKPARFRWRDCLAEMQLCGAMALPIVSLVSFLVGITVAYTGAIVLRLFGGDIWVADIVGLSITREMGAVMTAVVLAGRTGAAYAAHLGNMKANEEIDALTTLGVSPIEFLVAPRLVALALMTPLLALYANLLGILGGLIIALGILQIPPTAYWVEMLSIVDLSDIATGLIKASTFGMIIGMCGCLRGLQAERSASGVGQAATSAVVTAILLMVIADSLFAVIFNILGW